MSKKRNVVLFIASSLDGYIATKDESLDWLYDVEGEGDNGYSEFYSTVDTVVMGKKNVRLDHESRLQGVPIRKQSMLCVYKVFYGKY